MEKPTEGQGRKGGNPKMVVGGPSLNPGGRPAGSKDKKWATLQYWYERLEKSLEDPKMTVAQRAQIEMQMITVILGRKPLPPDSPEDSVENALAAQAYLKKLEDDARSGAKTAGG